jgi:Fic family protein
LIHKSNQKLKRRSLDEILKRITKKKSKLDDFRPLPSELVKNLETWYDVECTYSSNAIEENTLTRKETALVVEKGLTISGKTIQEHLDVINHMKALEVIKKLSVKKRHTLTIHDILDIHKIILKKIDDNNAGVLRRMDVRILGSTTIFPNYMKVPQLIDEYISWLVTFQDHPAKVAALAHLKLVGVHSFIDENGRTVRLIMNLLLLQDGYPIAVIKKEDRLKYINAVEKAVQHGNENDF